MLKNDIEMKVVLLLAGKGSRLGKFTENKHKAFIPLYNIPCLTHLLERLLWAGTTELIPILGFDSEAVYSLIREICYHRIKVTPIINKRYRETNNLGSLLCAREKVEENGFMVCNGDLVINKSIIKDLIDSDLESGIVIDDSNQSSTIDSPRVKVVDGRIYDLGRHISFEKSGGYAVGIYKFGRKLSPIFFEEAGKVFLKDQNAGFHDPLTTIFKNYPIYAISTKGRSWMDIDKKEDISHASDLLQKIWKEEGVERI